LKNININARKQLYCFSFYRGENWMKNITLAVIVALGVLLLIAVKYNLMPNFGSSLYEESKSQLALEEIQHEDGVFKDYYSNGSVRTETPYVNHKINGIVTNYYANGNVKSEQNYINDRLEGETKTYYKNGSLEKVYTYKNGVLNGPAKSYNKDGKLETTAEFADNVQVGTETGYYPDGKPSYTLQFNDKGIMEGKAIQYFENGKIQKKLLLLTAK